MANISCEKITFEKYSFYFSNVVTINVSGSSYKELLKPGGFLGSDSPLNLSFSFYTDGINPFKSPNKQHLWPIFLMINELPPELR